MADEHNHSHRSHHHHHRSRNPEMEAAYTEKISPEELKGLNEGLREAIESSAEGTAENSAETERRHYRGKGNARKSKKKNGPGKIVLIVLGVLLGIVLVACLSIFILQRMGAGRLQSSNQPDESAVEKLAEAVGDEDRIEEEGLIRYKGETYRYNDELVTILFMGVDRSLQAEDNEENVIGTNGQADTLVLGVIDNKNEKISLINISRDTIAQVALYNTDGEYLGLTDTQICLAYAFGDGKKTSCENVVRAVSDYFYGIPIAAYAAINYEGIGVLTEVVGGVEVTIPDDFFASSDPAMTKGSTVVLDGRQAIAFVRARDSYSYEANNGRMQRQKQFLLSLIRQTLAATKQNFTLPLALYSSVSDYMVTSVNASEITYLSSKAVQYGFSEQNLRSIVGESRMLEDHAAFYADEEKFYELILEVFYNKV